MIRPDRRIGEILKSKGLITQDDLDAALAEHARTGEFTGAILVARKVITEDALLSVLAEQFGMQIIQLKDKYIDWDVVKDFSPSLIVDHACFPVRRDEWTVTMAITNPLDAWVLKRAQEEAFPLRPRFVLTARDDIAGAVARYKQRLKGSL